MSKRSKYTAEEKKQNLNHNVYKDIVRLIKEIFYKIHEFKFNNRLYNYEKYGIDGFVSLFFWFVNL